MKRSNNLPSKKNVQKSNQIPKGDNITASVPGVDIGGGDAFGVGDFGGFEHFNGVVRPKVDH